MLVQQILTSKPTGGVVTVRPSATLAQAVAVLAEHRIGAVVVSGDGIEVAGILSERDVVRELGRHGPRRSDTVPWNIVLHPNAPKAMF